MRGCALLWLLASACTTSMYEEVAQDVDGACIALEGHTFVAADPACTTDTDACHQQLSFDIDSVRTSQVTWLRAGASEVGKVSCRGAVITVTTPTRTLRATFDPTTLHVQWAGQTYVAQ